jgi:hypothetical protein
VRDWFLDEKIACKIARMPAGTVCSEAAGKVFIKKEKARAPSKKSLRVILNFENDLKETDCESF